MLELLTDDELRQQLGKQAREYAQQYDWGNIVSRMLKVYRELV